jgi:hypothetical protein
MIKNETMYLVTMYSSTHGDKPVAVFPNEAAARAFIWALEMAKSTSDRRWWDAEPIDFFPEQTPKEL